MGARFDIDSLYEAQRDAERRKSDLDQMIADLEQHRADIENELADLATTIRTVQRVISATDDDPGVPDEDGGHPRGAIRKAIEKALHTFARDGKTAGEIREFVRQRDDMDIPANTVSVTLNRLKTAHIAKLEGQLWSPATIAGARSLEDLGFPSREQMRSDLDDEIPF